MVQRGLLMTESAALVYSCQVFLQTLNKGLTKYKKKKIKRDKKGLIQSLYVRQREDRANGQIYTCIAVSKEKGASAYGAQ